MREKATAGDAGSLMDDLAYVRTLAEEGRDTPLVGGAFYVLWGGLMGVAALIAYLAQIDVLTAPTLGYSPFIVAFAVGWAASMWLGRRKSRAPGAATLGNRTASAVWFAVGLFLTLFWFTLMIVHARFESAGVPAWFLFNLMFPVAFGFYGVAFYATAVAGRVGWLKYFAFAAFGFAAATMFFMASATQMLIGGVGTLVVAALPGALLMRSEPSEII